jgi:hypothetical protein
MFLDVYDLGRSAAQRTYATLKTYLDRTGWRLKAEDVWAATNGTGFNYEAPDQSAAIHFPPEYTACGYSREWQAAWMEAIETLATFEEKRLVDVTVPYLVLQEISEQRLKQYPLLVETWAFATLFPYRDILDDVLIQCGTCAPEDMCLRGALAAETARRWSLIYPEQYELWVLSYQVHIRAETAGYLAWIETVT